MFGNRRLLAMLAGRRVAMSFSGHFAVALGRGRAVTIASSVAVGRLLPVPRRRGTMTIAFRHDDFRLYAIGLVVELRDKTFDIGFEHVDPIAEELAIWRGKTIDVTRREHTRRDFLRHMGRVGNIDDIGADGAAAHAGTILRTVRVQHDDLHKIGFLRLLHCLGHAQRRLDARQPVAGLVGRDERADPETVLLVDFDRGDLGAFEPVQFGIGRAEQSVCADIDGGRTRATEGHENPAQNQHELS